MNLLLDFAWKFLFFVSIFSTFYFLAMAFLPNHFKLLPASKKVAAIKVSKIFLILSFISVSLYLMISDNDLVVDCFGHFASKEGVFGVTRVISSIWLAGFILFLIKDVLGYVFAIRNLNRSVLAKKSLTIQSRNSQLIEYYEVNNDIEPVVAGFFFPEIYIPKSVSTDQHSLKQILSHEYIHFKNKDSIWSFAGLVIHRLNWHNPLSYIAVDAEKTNLEMATDEQAVADFNLDITAYANSLVNLVSHQSSQSVLVMNVSGSFLQIQSRLLNLKNLQNGLIERKSLYGWILFLVLGFGLTQAFASIRQETQSVYQAPMCFQVKHELMIESWMTAKKPESNKCE